MRKDLSAIFAMLMGAGGAQVIALLFTPLLTRLYPPEAFGHLGVFVALAALLIPIAALTLPMAIVVTQTHTEARKVSVLAVVIALLSAAVFACFIHFNFEGLAALLNAQGSGHYLYWVPAAVLFSALLQINEHWMIKLSLFKLRAQVSIVHALLINCVKLLLGWWFPTATSLIFVAIINPLLNALLLFWRIKDRILSSQKPIFKFAGNWQSILIKHQGFPKFQAPQAFLNAAALSMPVIILATFFGPASAGYYAFSRTILTIPIMLIGKAVGDVFYSRIAQEVNAGNVIEVKKNFLQATLLLAVVGCLPLVLILLWGPEIFSFVFGDKWYQAGIYAQWLSIWTFFILINAPSLKVIIALKQQKKSLLVNMLTMPVRVAALFIGGYYLKNEWFAIQLFVAISVLHNMIIILLAYISCKKEIRLEKVLA